MTDPFTATEAKLLAEDRAGDNAAPVSVSDLANRLKRHVESAFGHVRLRGEISGWKRAASGHAYLKLKDADAAIDAVIWKGGFARIAFVPGDGVEVVVTGKLTTYPARSTYQLVIESMELAGEGALLAMLERTRLRLAAEGLFDQARKRPLPFLPQRIGVVTSPTGAVIRDILHRLADRCPSHVVVWPVLVQGQEAAGQISAAVAGFNAMDEALRPDLLIVARGGGSIEDLWPFNDERVVRAVAASAIPVISAVGHETDTSLCDFAADVRAPTPTAAAERAVPVRADLRAGLATLGARQWRAVNRTCGRAQERIDAAAKRLPTPDQLLSMRRQRTDESSERLRRGLRLRLTAARGDLAAVSGALRPALLRQIVARHRAQLDRTEARLSPTILTTRLVDGERRLQSMWRLAQSYHPDRPLKRGYARVSDPAGHVVATAARARAAMRLTLHFVDGAVDTHIDAPAAPTKVERKPAMPYQSAADRQPKLI